MAGRCGVWYPQNAQSHPTWPRNDVQKSAHELPSDSQLPWIAHLHTQGQITCDIDSIYEVIGPCQAKSCTRLFLDPGRLSRAPVGRSSGPLTVFPDLHN